MLIDKFYGIDVMMANEAMNSLPKTLSELANLRFDELSAKYSDIQALTDTQSHLLRQVIGLSDFVFDQLMVNPQWIEFIFAGDLLLSDSLIPTIEQQIEQVLSQTADEKGLERNLRLLRNQFQVMIAWRDLCHLVPLEHSLQEVSHLAQQLILGARDWLAQSLAATWGYPTDEQGNRQPMLIIGMGKLGGRELNFSSDIDLIFTFPEHGQTVGGRRSTDNQQFFVKLAQKLINALDKRTFDGFVYRVDMRLRPFGNSGPLVASFAAIEDYYQLQGRDWERYAMVKGRVLGPQCQYSQQLQDLLRPFMFRRYIDFSAIESLRQMKQMISHEVHRRGLIDNIKLGSGGIREVEFIVQVFQMIRGGRQPELQDQSLLNTLNELQRLGIFNATEISALRCSYLFLRACEQYLQQFADQQTQTLPDNAQDWTRLCYLTNNSTEQEFRDELQVHLDTVSEQFSLVVGEDEAQDTSSDKDLNMMKLIFDSNSDFDGESVLFELGCKQPQALFREIHVIKDDIDKRPMGPRGLEAMNKLMPLVLLQVKELGQCAVVLERIGKILAKIATRTTYIELLLENPGALAQLVRLCEASCWIAEQLTHFPMLLDELLDPKLLYQVTPLEDYPSELRRYLMRIPDDDMEQMMEGLRQFKQVQQLHIAAADVTGVMPVTKVSDHLTALAQAIIEHVVDLAWAQLVGRFGEPVNQGAEKGFAVIGYGKLGGIELGYGSDLDLVFVHCAQLGTMTNGSKSVESHHFYLKLAQRIIHLFNTRTNSGILYEVDMRLRPSGNSGLMVSHFDTFVDYQQQEAWVWEHQALVRTRVVYGELYLQSQFSKAREALLQNKRDLSELQKEVVKMRIKMRDNLSKGTENLFDLKQDDGGVADIEFIAQYLVLAHSHHFPQLTEFSDNIRIFESVAQHELLSESDCKALETIYCRYRNAGHRLALQNESNLVDIGQFKAEREAVVTIWRQLFPALQ